MILLLLILFYSYVSSLLKPTGVKCVVYNVSLNISNDEIMLCSKKQQVKFVERFNTKSFDSDKKTTFMDSKTALLYFSCLELLNFVSIGYLRFVVKQSIPHVVLNAIDLAILL